MGRGTTYAPESYWTDLHRRHRDSLAAVGWPALGEGFNRETYKLRLEAVQEGLAEAGCTSVSSVLEAAVGVGAYAPLWEDLGATRWVGLDISPEAVADLTARFPRRRFVTADLAAPDFDVDGDRFDLVTAIDVLFHLTDDDAFETALRNLAGTVDPGGLLVVTGVFLDQPNQTASHVRHRPLAAHTAAIGPGFDVVARHSIFAILDGAVPATAKGKALYVAWKLVSGLLRVAPASIRGRLGSALVRLLAPLDRALRRAGVAAGSNLEMAVYRRAG